MTLGTHRASSHAHELVAETAAAAAAELYETLMSNDEIRKEWKRQHPEASEKQLLKAFVDRNIARCLPLARATLARMLATSTDDVLKEQISEALILDASLLRGRGQPTG